jgi:redox-sensing transcriptional repressor
MTIRRTGRDERSAQVETNGGAGISRPILERLALYYQIILRMGEEGRDTFSSAQLATLLQIDPTLARKDMAAAGVVGRPKVGYLISDAVARLDEILGLSSRNDAILIGCGHLGGAIAAYPGFAQYGLKIAAIFDIDHSRVGQRVGGHVVLPIEKCKSILSIFRIQIAILTVPAAVAQEISDWLVGKGVRAIWNFAPVQLQVPSHVVVRNENLALGLAQLIHHLKRVKSHDTSSEQPSNN